MASEHRVEVLACGCKHVFQDKHYGLGKRLWNVVKHAGKTTKTVKRCTVCGKEVVL